MDDSLSGTKHHPNEQVDKEIEDDASIVAISGCFATTVHLKVSVLVFWLAQ